MRPGERVEMVYSTDPMPVPTGERGTVIAVDSLGTVHVAWDSGRTLGCIPGEDDIVLVRNTVGAS